MNKQRLKREVMHNQTMVPRKEGSAPMKEVLKRSRKSCRLKCTDCLKPDHITPQEEELIISLHAAIGSRWSMIAQQLPGRTDSDVKNHWNTKLRKKLTERGIDPVTHKPFSQILADYGSIGGFPEAPATRISSLGRNMKNTFKRRPAQEQFPVPKNHLMVMSPKIKPDDDKGLDLFAELQAITLVNEKSSFINEAPSMTLSSSPLASSSSTLFTATHAESMSGFSWKDFLLDDETLPDGPQEMESAAEEFVSKGFPDQTVSVTAIKNDEVDNIIREEKMDCSFEHPSSPNSSFVEAILDQDSEILMGFPGILDEPFIY